jgi:tetratricopeptide (TPR) repeat protein
MKIMRALAVALALTGTAYADSNKEGDASYKQALALEHSGKTDEAIKVLQDVTSKYPNFGLAWASLGHSYKKKGDLPKSIDAYEHAVKFLKDPKELKIVWLNLGGAYANTEPARLDDAITALTTACRLDLKDAEIRHKLGVVLSKKGDAAKAIVELEFATKLKADDGAEWHDLGLAYRRGKRDDDAIKAYQKAIELEPNEARYHFDLGAAYRRKQDPDKAIPEYEKATSLDPGNADGWFDLGFMYKENHENDKAVDALKHYLDANKGKDTAGAKRAQEECTALGGKCDDKAAKPDKKPPPKKK